LQVLVNWLGHHPKLADWEPRTIHAEVEKGPRDGDCRDCHEREVAVEAPGEPEAGGPHRRIAASILRYEIFPPQKVCPVLRRHPVEVGDTLGCRYHFMTGLDIFFAARVIDRFDGFEGNIWRTGFTYRTVNGHPELGEETFAAEKCAETGRVRVVISSWSRPGSLLTRAFYPLARRLQVQAGRSALDHLARIASL